jgi:hypothetical protein
MAVGNWPQLYAESLADVGDVAEEIGSPQGGYYEINKLVATVDNKWIGVPWIAVQCQAHARHHDGDSPGQPGAAHTWKRMF